MQTVILAVFAFFFTFFLSEAIQAKEIGRTLLKDRESVIVLNSLPHETGEADEGLVVNRLATLEIIQQDHTGKELAFKNDVNIIFDARMPEHNHGMVVSPVLEKKSPARVVVKGVKFHMPGQWEITLILASKVEEEKLKFPLSLRLTRLP